MTDEQRDLAEEMANAMIPYYESCEKVFEKGWNVDNLLDYMKDHCPTVERSGVEIHLWTGLLEAPDGSLWRPFDDE